MKPILRVAWAYATTPPLKLDQTLVAYREWSDRMTIKAYLRQRYGVRV